MPGMAVHLDMAELMHRQVFNDTPGRHGEAPVKPQAPPQAGTPPPPRPADFYGRRADSQPLGLFFDEPGNQAECRLFICKADHPFNSIIGWMRDFDCQLPPRKTSRPVTADSRCLNMEQDLPAQEQKGFAC